MVKVTLIGLEVRNTVIGKNKENSEPCEELSFGAHVSCAKVVPVLGVFIGSLRYHDWKLESHCPVHANHGGVLHVVDCWGSLCLSS